MILDDDDDDDDDDVDDAAAAAAAAGGGGGGGGCSFYPGFRTSFFLHITRWIVLEAPNRKYGANRTIHFIFLSKHLSLCHTCHNERFPASKNQG